jgi:hypothetical protein
MVEFGCVFLVPVGGAVAANPSTQYLKARQSPRPRYSQQLVLLKLAAVAAVLGSSVPLASAGNENKGEDAQVIASSPGRLPVGPPHPVHHA